jgi:protein-tyrosine phosphatase
MELMYVRAADRLTNGRDLGGLATADGRTVRPDLVFRSDDTGWSHGARPAAFPERMSSVFDLRRPEEIAGRGLPWFVDGGTRRINVNLSPVSTAASTITDDAELAGFYLRLFDARLALLGEIVDELARTDQLPAAVYCVAGKDRTGVVVATLGRLLGVTDDALVADFVKSASFMEGVRDSGQLGDVGDGVLLPLLDARAPAMRLFLDGVTSRYPTADDLARGLGLDGPTLSRLRERYLSPTASS